MAGRGPAPKDPATRRRRNAPSVPTTTVVTDDVLRGPDLPQPYSWHPQTRAWWETWRRSPQAQAMTPTDWDFMLDTAVLHSGMWYGEAKLAAEVRLRVAKFGATPEDRARLRLQVDEAPSAAAAVERPAGRYDHLRVVGE
jgi:hypothetical protein